MSKNFVESIVGAAVIIIAAYFLYYAYFTTQVVANSTEGYTLFAKFDRADGINPGGDIKVAGIKIGKVISQNLDPKTFQAILKLQIMTDVKLPVDTSAEIIGDGLLGGKYIALVPGAETEKLNDKDTIEFTQSAVSLESLIGKFIFNSAAKTANDNASNPALGTVNPNNTHK